MNIDEFKDFVEKKYSQIELAHYLGVTRARVWNWVHGYRKVPLKFEKEIRKAMKEIEKKHNELPPVAKAIRIAGGQKELAKRCGVSQGAVSKWLRQGVIGAKNVIKVEKAVGIPRTELNPLIYPPD